MKALSIVLALSFIAAGLAVAEQYPEFIALMKTANNASSALRKMDKKTGPQATRAAERLGSVYEEMIPFWRQREADTAVKISIDGKAAALELASAAHAGDAERAEAAFKTLAGTCHSCHEAHRETLAEGKFKIK